MGKAVLASELLSFIVSILASSRSRLNKTRMVFCLMSVNMLRDIESRLSLVLHLLNRSRKHSLYEMKTTEKCEYENHECFG